MEGRAAHDSLDQVRVMQIAKESVGERHTAKCGGLSTSVLGQLETFAEDACNVRNQGQSRRCRSRVVFRALLRQET